MDKFITIAQLIVAVLLTIIILFQNRGSGVSSIFGGGGGTAFRTKRGMEKKLHLITIILSILFLGLSLANLLV